MDQIYRLLPPLETNTPWIDPTPPHTYHHHSQRGSDTETSHHLPSTHHMDIPKHRPQKHSQLHRPQVRDLTHGCPIQHRLNTDVFSGAQIYRRSLSPQSHYQRPRLYPTPTHSDLLPLPQPPQNPRPRKPPKHTLSRAPGPGRQSTRKD